MEEAVISRGGRVPDTVTIGSAASVMLASGNNIISASYIAATTANNNNNNRISSSATTSSCANQSWWGTLAAASPTTHTDGRYTYMDEEYLRCLQAHVGWERDNGIIHLMPIAVVYQEDVS